jgi:hypothetical protein
VVVAAAVVAVVNCMECCSSSTFDADCRTQDVLDTDETDLKEE